VRIPPTCGSPFGACGESWNSIRIGPGTGCGINAGGGVMGYFGDRVGLRADLRYFRTGFGDFDFFDFESVDFWRASIGLVIR